MTIKYNFGRVTVEELNNRMKKTCDECDDDPATVGTGTRRLKVVKGSGKWQTSKVYCMDCGLEEIDDWIDELKSFAKELSGEYDEE